MKHIKNNKKKLTVSGLILTLLIGGIALYEGLTEAWDAWQDPSLLGPYTVTRVVDGDTLILQMEGREEKVRLIGVDTPESVHNDLEKNVPYGAIASAYTKEMLEGKKVELEMDAEERDHYGRLLAYVYLEGEMFNRMLLTEGHATTITVPPNVKYSDEFRELQEEAKRDGRGLWKEPWK